jgi:RimJ/RimL family protein N-acetyltransferase
MLPLDVQPVILDGNLVRLEPLSLTHVIGLARFGKPELFQFFGGITVKEASEAGVEAYVKGRLSLANTVSYAMVLKSDGLAVGHSSYMSIRPADGVVEIGGTWIGEPYQGTFVNPEVKHLMIGHAFETLGCVRVELKTDERNLQSQNAMLKLGLIKEGVLRRHCINSDGYIRNSVYFSVLPEEWPAMKARLESRLATLSAT